MSERNTWFLEARYLKSYTKKKRGVKSLVCDMFGTTACLFFLFEQNITTSYKIIFFKYNTYDIFVRDVINVNKYIKCSLTHILYKFLLLPFINILNQK